MLVIININIYRLSKILGCAFLFFFLHAQSLSYVQLFVTPWTVVLQAPLSTGILSKNTGVGAISFCRGFPDPGFEPTSPALAGEFFPTKSPGHITTTCKF